ncbi:MAG: hypothetical protein RI897_2158 [Verrucomicrobiota bacterium]
MLVLLAGGDEEQEQRHEHGDRSIVDEFWVMEEVAPAGDREGAEIDWGTEGPEESGGGEDGGDRFFFPGHGTECGVLLVNLGTVDLDIGVGFIDDFCEHEPGEQEHGGGDGDTEEAPRGERNGGCIGKGAFEDDLKDEVGRCADERGDTSDGAGVGDTEHEGGAEGGGLVASPAVFKAGEYGHADGEHGDCGGGIGDPGGEEGAGGHEAEDEAGRAVAEVLECSEGDTAVEVPAFHGEGDEEAAEVEEDGGVDVVGGDFFAAGDAEQGEEHEGEERGGGERGGFGDPPDGHERGDGGHGAEGWQVGVWVEEQDDQREEGQAEDEAEPAGGTTGCGIGGHGVCSWSVVGLWHGVVLGDKQKGLVG